ncbi:MAG: Asp-tRNA(Asn)/Glu-tRNA(Gln) amidotransferase subunit GatA [Desulfobacterales bacterium]
MHLYELTIHEAARLLKNKEITSEQLTTSVLERIEQIEDKVSAYITVCADPAIEQARAADQIIAKGKASPLTGIPLAVKDLICTKGTRTTCGSLMLENFVPPFDATIMKKLNRQHAVMVGKTNMDEFAMGSSNEHSAFRPTRNPWDLSRIPGGSSGGSAAATSADMCIGAIGSDTGGSIRQPASHCSVTGLKPTYGRISRYGLVAFASSLDQIGPITKDVTDAALLMNAIAGYDPADSTSVPKEVPDYTSALKQGLKGVKVGIPKEYFETEGVDPAVLDCVEKAIATICDLGAERVEVTLPRSQYGVAAYYVIAPCEASSNLARYDGVKYGYRASGKSDMIDMYRATRSKGFGAEVKRRIIIGTYCLSSGYYDAYYQKASQVRTLIMEDYQNAFKSCDVILAPVAPTPAFKIGEKVDDPLTMYLSDIFTLSVNLAGIPGISIPCGFSPDGLPVGLQILGNHFCEESILKTAYNFEQATEFHKQKPACR